MCGSDEPHPCPERSSPIRLSTSGHASYKGRSCILCVCVCARACVYCIPLTAAKQTCQMLGLSFIMIYWATAVT